MNKEMTMTDWPDAAPEGATRSLLAEDLVIDGEVSSSGPIDVTGKITGSVRASDVLVTAAGRVSGRITAQNVFVHGSVDGTIEARAVTLSSTAKVQADITHDLMTMETGARFEGRMKRRS